VYLEERVSELERTIEAMQEKIKELEGQQREPEILTIKQAANKLQCSESTVRRRIESGALRTVPGYSSRVIVRDLF
jgi:excisionase family DNA binding protein